MSHRLYKQLVLVSASLFVDLLSDKQRKITIAPISLPTFDPPPYKFDV